MFEDIDTKTPSPSEKWTKMTSTERFSVIENYLENSNYSDTVALERCEDSGYAYFSLTKEMSASERGIYLLDLEVSIKNNIDEAITVWLLPKDDKNKLRKLRGIEVSNQ